MIHVGYIWTDILEILETILMSMKYKCNDVWVLNVLHSALHLCRNET